MIGNIRAAQAIVSKDMATQDFISHRAGELNASTLMRWRSNPHLVTLSVEHANGLPIFSFLVRRRDGSPFHHQLFTRILSDVFGIQSRGGCACVGPYAHRLLGINEDASRALAEDLRNGNELDKPGWFRLNFSYLLSDAQGHRKTDSVNELIERMEELEAHYDENRSTARFTPVKKVA